MNTRFSDHLLVERARIYATAAHDAVGQVRKYTQEAYIVHPREVAEIVSHLPEATPEMVAAAWLHDVVEDTQITLLHVLAEFDPKVAELVGWVTDPVLPGEGNRESRTAAAREKLAQAPAEAQSIKLADLISNTRSICEHDPDFARVYLEEKRQLLEVMNQGNPDLYRRAKAQVSLDDARIVS